MELGHMNHRVQRIVTEKRKQDGELFSRDGWEEDILREIEAAAPDLYESIMDQFGPAGSKRQKCTEREYVRGFRY